jgi:hypothetical protein
VTVECPKCGLSPVAGDACTRCGLSADRMATWSVDEVVPERIVEAWSACRAAWDDAAAHDRAASLALTVDAQPWLARQYRAVLRERPDDAIAGARLERLVKIAQAAVLASGTTPRPGFRRGISIALLAVLSLVVAGGLFWGLTLIRRHRESSDPRVQRADPADARARTHRIPGHSGTVR